MDSKTNIQVSREIRDAIAALGSKGDSYDDIVRMMFHQRNILLIHNYCKDKVLGDEILFDLAGDILLELGIQCPQYFIDNSLKGNGETVPFTEDTFYNCCEMATDEDLVGSAVAHGDRQLPLAEAITNVYCLAWQIPAPTWSMGGMRNPFSF